MDISTNSTAPAQWFTLQIPKSFINDHAKRGLIEYQYDQNDDIRPWVIKETKRHYTVQLHLVDTLDLLSDAHHYSTQWSNMGGVGSDFAGLGSSALATKTTVHRQMIEQGYQFTPLQIRDWSLK